MEWYEIVELTCTIFSASSLLASLILLIIYFFHNLSIFVEVDNDLIEIYGSAHKHQMIATKIHIVENNGIEIDTNGFFADGVKEKSLDVNNYVLLKQIPYKQEYKKIKIKLTFLKHGEKTYCRRIKGKSS